MNERDLGGGAEDIPITTGEEALGVPGGVECPEGFYVSPEGSGPPPTSDEDARSAETSSDRPTDTYQVLSRRKRLLYFILMA